MGAKKESQNQKKLVDD